ncbi:PilZ domain protein [bacterium BMS3Abin09]|nr:PilZ domain protein [bacterium BMS3Abin09]GBE41860.1 PilZ domain protein [bacterium BMS3Bbin09]
MGKRGIGRVSTNLPVGFYWGSDLHEGVVTNLSGKGMFIESEICPASGSDIEVALIVGDEAFNISGKVKRTENSNGSSSGIGVELLCPSVNYRKFVCIVYDYEYNVPCLKPRSRAKRIKVKVAS